MNCFTVLLLDHQDFRLHNGSTEDFLTRVYNYSFRVIEQLNCKLKYVTGRCCGFRQRSRRAKIRPDNIAKYNQAGEMLAARLVYLAPWKGIFDRLSQFREEDGILFVANDGGNS